MSSRKNETQELADAAAQQGWRVIRGTKGLRLLSPDGETIIHMANDPRDWRATRNNRLRLRRAGVKV